MPSLNQVSLEAEHAVLEEHRRFLEGIPHDSPLLPLNQSAIRRFKTLKFPRGNHEMFTYVDLKKILPLRFTRRKTAPSLLDAAFIQKHTYADCRKSFITLLDGTYRRDLSNCSGPDSSLTLKALDAALSDPSVGQYLAEKMGEENDVFAALNRAFLTRGLFLEVAPERRLQCPIQILVVTSGSDRESVSVNPGLFLKLGEKSTAKVVIKYVGAGGNYFVNSALDLILEPGAKMNLVLVQDDRKDARHFSKNRATLSRDAGLSLTSVSWGSELTRHHHEIRLRGEGSELQCNGLSVLEGREQAHHYVRVFHEVPHCTSRQLFRNILKGRGHSSVDGTVVVREGAGGTFSDQLINNLMLSEEAKAENKPNLMIYNDDVKCTHGATISRIDEDHLFYFQTRGISRKKAEIMLAGGFAKSALGNIDSEALREKLNQTLREKLG